MWKGVDVFDTYLGEKINLKTMCMWSIHDFPTYGLFVGCVTKRHVNCPPCGPFIKVRSSKKLNKMVYCGPHRYLLKNHQVIDELKWLSTGK